MTARLAVDELNELLDADLPEGDWDTVGGLLFNVLGRVPGRGRVGRGRRRRASWPSGSRATASAGSASSPLPAAEPATARARPAPRTGTDRPAPVTRADRDDADGGAALGVRDRGGPAQRGQVHAVNQHPRAPR